MLGKREISIKFQPTKLTKLSDIASNALIANKTSIEVPKENSEEIQEEEESAPAATKKRKGWLPCTKKFIKSLTKMDVKYFYFIFFNIL